GTLKPKQLEEVRQAAAPFFNVYYVDAHDHPVLPGDTRQAPRWMLSQAARLEAGTMQTYRPLPPGMDIDLSGQTEPPPSDLGDDYLTCALRGRSGWMFADADLGYLFGPWLDEQCRLIDVGHVQARRVDHEVLWKEGASAPHGNVTEGSQMLLRDIERAGSHRGGWGRGHWTRRVTVLPTTGSWPMDAVELSLDVGPELAGMQQL